MSKDSLGGSQIGEGGVDTHDLDSTFKQSPSAEPSLIQRIILAGILVLVVLVFTVLIFAASLGLDFTDESFYLLWIISPSDYPLAFTLFGFAYHPLFVAVGENIFLLRVANILILGATGLALGHSALRATIPNRLSGTRWVIAVGLAVSAVLPVTVVSATPSHNSLSLTGLMVCAVGFLYTGRDAPRVALVGWALMPIGFWIVFLARPTSALLLLVLLPVALALARRFTKAGFAVGVCVSILVVSTSIWAISGSLSAFLNRLSGAAELEAKSGGGHTILEITSNLFTGIIDIGPPIDAIPLILAIAIASAILVALLLALGWLRIVGLVFTLVMIFVANYTIAVGFSPLAISGVMAGFFMLGPILAAMFGVLLFTRMVTAKPRKWGRRTTVALLALFPWVYAFGTNNDLWSWALTASIFWIIALTMLMAERVRERDQTFGLTPVAVGTIFTVGLVISTALANPYRQPGPLSENIGVADFGERGTLNVSRRWETYINSLQATAYGSGFRAGTPLIDLTGGTPGAALVLDATAPGTPWLARSSPDPSTFAVTSLNNADCLALSQAWLLVQPDNPQAIPESEVLASFGASWPDDYVVVGTIPGPFGGIQGLFKPVRSDEEAEFACQSVRAG